MNRGKPSDFYMRACYDTKPGPAWLQPLIAKLAGNQGLKAFAELPGRDRGRPATRPATVQELLGWSLLGRFPARARHGAFMRKWHDCPSENLCGTQQTCASSGSAKAASDADKKTLLVLTLLLVLRQQRRKKQLLHESCQERCLPRATINLCNRNRQKHDRSVNPKMLADVVLESLGQKSCKTVTPKPR